MHANLTTPLAWAALVARFEPESTTLATQNGTITAFRVNEPIVDIVTHDLEVARWEGVGDWVEMIVEDLNADILATIEAASREEALAELAALNAMHEDEVQTPVQMQLPSVTVEPSPNGRYVIAKCDDCQHRASGLAADVEHAMAVHAKSHATKAKTKPRCEVHGVWAREDDGRCKRCDAITDPVEAVRIQSVMQENATGAQVNPDAGALLHLLVEKLKESHATQVTQEITPEVPAKMTLGIRGNGLLARRSAHELAPVLGVPQRELAKKDANEVRSLVLARGIDADWVPAASL